MKYSIDNFIGEEAKRTTFALYRTDKKYYSLFCIIERLESDAEDNVFGIKQKKLFRDDIAHGDKDKIFVVVDYITLDEVLVREPWSCAFIEGTEIILEMKDYQWYNDGRSI